MGNIGRIEKNEVLVQLIIRNSCSICTKVETTLRQFDLEYHSINLQVFDLENNAVLPANLQPFITPAIWVNGVLWYLGGLDYQRFVDKLNLLKIKEDLFIDHKPLTTLINRGDSHES